MSKRETTSLLRTLRMLERERPMHRTEGICGELMPYFPSSAWPIVLEELGAAWVQWPHFSGDVRYPVPGGVRAWTEYHNRDKWDPTTAYGSMRWDLLRFLVRFFSEKAEKQNRTSPMLLEAKAVRKSEGGLCYGRSYVAKPSVRIVFLPPTKVKPHAQE